MSTKKNTCTALSLLLYGDIIPVYSERIQDQKDYWIERNDFLLDINDLQLEEKSKTVCGCGCDDARIVEITDDLAAISLDEGLGENGSLLLKNDDWVTID